MTVLISNRTLLNMEPGWWPTSTGGSVSLYNGYSKNYAVLYKEQPNVRTCVDFLARNIAQLGLHLYRMDEEKGRIRLRDHPMAILLGRPLPNQMKFTRYRMIESLMSDMGIYGNAFLKKEINSDGVLEGLVRLPPSNVTIKGALIPTLYDLNLGDGKPKSYQPDEIVHFRSYSSESNVKGMSPLETLRRVLAEEHAAALYREKYWENSARMNGVLMRPTGSPEWSETARQRFKKEWQALYAGPDNSGKTAILEEGMTFDSISFNPKDSEYLEGRKLTREECARAYHIPPPLVGILDHATYSNIKSQHKSLYTDVLGPWLAMIEEDLQMQLLSDFDDSKGVYLEFNIQEKMQGDFETQAKSIQSATGVPWMTVNEAREIMNLPKIEGADELVVPLNVMVGNGDGRPEKGKKTGDGGQETGQRLDGAQLEDMTSKNFLAYLLGLERLLKSGFSAEEVQAMADSAWKEIASQARNDNKKTGDGGQETGDAPKASQLESFDVRYPELRKVYDEKWRSLLVKTFERQRNAILPLVGGEPKGKAGHAQPLRGDNKKDISAIWDAARWNSEVTADFTPLSMGTALAWAQSLAKELGIFIADDELKKYIDENARIAAEYLNESTRAQIESALEDEDPKSAVQKIFQMLLAVTVARFAIGRVTGLSSYGSYKAAIKGGITTKTWVVNSTNPRDSHAAMNGETVGIYERFSNGMRWPGDYEGSAEETVNCECSLRYNRESGE